MCFNDTHTELCINAPIQPVFVINLLINIPFTMDANPEAACLCRNKLSLEKSRCLEAFELALPIVLRPLAR